MKRRLGCLSLWLVGGFLAAIARQVSEDLSLCDSKCDRCVLETYGRQLDFMWSEVCRKTLPFGTDEVFAPTSANVLFVIRLELHVYLFSESWLALSIRFFDLVQACRYVCSWYSLGQRSFKYTDG